jgi:hypothetical protein
MQSASGSAMDKFIQRENLALFRRRLADPALTDAQRQTILRLLTEERAKGMTAETNSLVVAIEIGGSRQLLMIKDLTNAANESHRRNAIAES